MLIRFATWLDTMAITVMWLKMHQEVTKRKALLEENSNDKNLFVQVLSRVEDPNWTVLIAEKEGEVAGFVMGKVYWPPYNKCHIIGACEALYVYPEHRDNIIYKQLVYNLKEEVEKKGATEFELTCPYDKRFLDFYDSLGYEPIHVTMRQKEAI